MKFKLFSHLVFILIFVLSLVTIVSLSSKADFGRVSDFCIAVSTIILCVIAGIFVSQDEEENRQRQKLRKMLRDTERRGRSRRYGVYDFGYNGAIRDMERTIRRDL